MTKQRLEAFSDGVIAILITIMVLELHTPEGDRLQSLRPLVPVLLAYVLSFVFLGIYWVNHHHMLQVTHRVSGGILWANLHLLFWLSLVPLMTRWVGANPTSAVPTALYGVNFIFAAIAYTILQTVIISVEGRDSILARAVRRDWKGKLSIALYAAGIATAFLSTAVADAFYVTVALIWLVPDRRIEANISAPPSGLEPE